jgi:hypothetical protein
MFYEGIAVHKRHNEEITYQIYIPFERIKHGMPIATVNKSRQLPEGFIAVVPPDHIYESVELSMAA